MTEAEQEILQFVAAQTGYKLNRLSMASRLSEDVGVDGDDAVEFFRAFEAKYQVDLTALHSHWDRHFFPEGISVGMGGFLAIGVALIAGGLLHLAYHPIPAWASTIGVLVICAIVHAKFFAEPERLIPISMQDLADAAKSRAWKREYDPKTRNDAPL